MVRKVKVNKSEAIRDYLADHPEAGPKEVAEALKDLGVKPAFVSNVKTKLGRKQLVTNEPYIAAAQFIRDCGGIKEAIKVFEAVQEIVTRAG
jgi:Mn-dependent DtxR family transcriptional regulator